MEDIVVMPMRKETFSIAIDGPAAAGKTTQAKRLAKRLGLTYVDTGAMYRALAVAVQESGRSVQEVMKDTVISVTRDEETGEQRMLVNGTDVTHKLRTPEISMLASDISKLKEVRQFLLDLQRSFAAETHVVMEGRDIGTVILPDATLKVYLTADLRERAARRLIDLWNEHDRTGGPVPDLFVNVKREMDKRDKQDMSRAEAPLRQADDAILLDNTDMSISDTTEQIERLFLKAVWETLR